MEEDVQALIGDCFLTAPISPKDVKQKKEGVGSTAEVDRIAEEPTVFSGANSLQRPEPRSDIKLRNPSENQREIY